MLNKLDAQFMILDTVAHYWKDIVKLFPAVGDKPEIRFESRHSNCAGKAAKSGKYVIYNLAYFCTHPDKFELEEIIVHELSHIVQVRVYPNAAQAHGPEFRTIMQLLGFSGKTYHYMSTAAAKKNAAKIRNEITLIDL